MKKTGITTLLLSLATLLSYSQEKEIKSGTYISTKQSEKLKLNLLDGNKYELIFLYGDYEKKGDTLYLGNQVGKKSCFSVKFGSDAAISNSVQIKLKSKYITTFMSQIYVGTQDGSLPVQYKRLSELLNNDHFDYDAEELNFTVNRSQYLYLVYETFEGKAAQSKYTIPNKVSEITADFEINGFADLQLKGYYNKESEEFIIADLLGKNPLAFKPENKTANEIKTEILPDEVKSLSKWTYEGKDKTDAEMGYAVADSAATAAVPGYNFKLKTEDNLADALKATKKAATKYLVLYYDPKNKNAKKEFEEFIQSQSTDIGYNLYDGYDAKYDLYNYYLLTDKDKNWIKKNAVKESPGVVVVNPDGLVLSTSKGNLDSNKSLFYYYDTFYSKLKRTDALAAFHKSTSAKKISDSELLKAFVQVSALDNYDVSGDSYLSAPPISIDDAPANLKKNETEEVVPVVEEIDATPVVEASYDAGQYKLTEVKLDKKQVETYWERLLKSHGKDTRPDMDLVGVIVKEIKNEGFYKQFFGAEKALDKANFEAIGYLLKHYDAILAEQNKKAANSTDSEYPEEKINRTISDALYKNNNSLSFGEVSAESQMETIEIYKQLISKDKSNLEISRNYFYLLSAGAEKLHMENSYIEEYDGFFNELFDGKKGVIEKIDELYTQKDSYDYESWADFKNYFSNLSNDVAWFVATKSNNPEYIKKAIKWSESGNVIAKNNAYYLDTLARLYYKNGEKEKAIKTQEQAVKYSESIDETTKNDIEATLQKMKDGTY